MKPTTDFDSVSLFGPRRRRPLIWIGVATIAMGVGGMSLRAGPIPVQPPIAPLPIAPTPARPATRPDRFLISAPAELDAAMVLRARDDIDPLMVFNPETRRRGSWPAASASAPLRFAPVPVPAPPR